MADDIVKVKIDTDTSDSIKSVAKYTAIIGAATIAVSKAIRMASEWSNAARDAEETASKYFTVFKNITPQASKAIKDLSNSFDLADSTAQKLLGDVGDILTGFGFTQESALDLASKVNTLAIDLASFTNFAGGAEGASQALTKALLGEAESVKALGIVIRQDTTEYQDLVSGIMEAQGVTLIQAKALAALQIATEQSKNAIGDYNRTSESFANAQRRAEESSKLLKEQLGGLVNDGLRPFVSWQATATRELANFIKGRRIAAVSEELEDLNKRLRAIQSGTVASTRKGGIVGFHVSDAKDSEKAAGSLITQITELEEKLKALRGESTTGAVTPVPTSALNLETEKTVAEELALLKLAEYNTDREYQDRITENLMEQADTRKKLLQEQADFEQMIFEQRLNAASTFFNGWAALAALGADQSTGLAIAFKALAAAEAGVNSYLAYTKALASAPWPWNVAAASGVLAKGLAAQAKIWATDVPKFAQGGSFVTSGAQMIMVGDNGTGRERVTIDPLGNTGGTADVGMIHNVIMLDGKPIADYMTKASRDGRMITSARSVK